MNTSRIVVGIDGSAPGLAALRWAAGEAQRHGVELHVLLAYLPPAPGPFTRPTPQQEKAAADAAEAVVAAAVSEAAGLAPGVNVHGKPVAGKPAAVLVQASDQAGLVVVGSRGGGGFAGLLLGSVSARVATQAACPVVVVRGRDDTGIGPVVVGVDGSAAADLATGLAFAEAARRGCTLAAVQAYHEPIATFPTTLPVLYPDPERYRSVLHDDLVARLAGWRDKYPEVPVDHIVAEGGAAGTLVACSHAAQLMVVGSRGHNAVGEALLGSVGLQLLHHADCPVLIARTRHDAVTGN